MAAPRAETRQVTLSAIGRDRPGIVAGLAEALFRSGCNLEDSSMTRLGGEFAVLLLIAVPTALSLAELQQTLDPVAARLGLTLSLRMVDAGQSATTGSLAHTLVVYGADRPGIVYRVTQAAAVHDLNITDLRSHVTSGATPVYTLIMEVVAASEAIAANFAAALEGLKSELGVDATFTRVDTDEL